MKGRVLAAWATIVRKSPSEYEKTVLRTPPASTPEMVFELVKDRIAREMGEVFYAICLDGNNHVLAMTEVARGGQHSVGVDIRSLFRVAVAYGASALILCHNHPSGSPRPSPEDVAMTKRAMAAGKVLGIPVVDHIIVAGERYASLYAMGQMEPEAQDTAA
jgi:DNA repair protein RadC